MYTVIGFVDKDFDYFKQDMTETQFGMRCTGFLQLRQIQNAGVFKEFFLTYLLFSRIDLNDANMKNLSIPGNMKA